MKRKYYVYGDLTMFYDRWGNHHTRIIGLTNWWIVAYFIALKWVDKHNNGSAFIKNYRMRPKELGWNNI